VSRFNVAVVGTGFIGPVHIEALRRLNINVLGILGSTPERARPKAEALGIDKVYATYEEVLADPNVDVVHLTSPNHLHYPQCKAALAAGKHIVCEKPLSMTSAESAELVTLAKASGLIHAVNFNIRFYPIAHHARDMVSEGKIGSVFAVHGSYLQDWLLYPSDWNWRLEPEWSGEMRAVADIGSHWLDLVSFITGLKIQSVCADFRTFLPVRKKPLVAQDTFTGKLEAQEVATEDRPIHTEDYASILLRFEDGARGVVTVSQVSAGRKNRLSFEIDGSESSLAYDSERPNELWIGHRQRPNEMLLKDPSLLSDTAKEIAHYPGGHNEGFPDTFKQLYSKVYAAVAAGKMPDRPDFPTFEDGHYEMMLGDAILTSAREDRWVEVQK
jgi:predicted dehydrogenase